MNGFISKAAAGLGLGSLLLALAGCHQGGLKYDNLVDPCWPERYNAMARQAVREPFRTQATNGHILDQTVWNWMFEKDKDVKTGELYPTERLSAAGREHLTHIVRRRPHADPKVFLQTAQDLAFDPAHPDKMLEKRAEMDRKRQDAVHRFLSIQAAGRQMPVDFQIVVHDPHEVGFSGRPYGGTESGVTPAIIGVVDKRDGGFQGTMPSGGGGGSSTMTMTSGGQ